MKRNSFHKSKDSRTAVAFATLKFTALLSVMAMLLSSFMVMAEASRKADAKVWEKQINRSGELSSTDPAEALKACQLALDEALLFKPGDKRLMQTYVAMYQLQRMRGLFEESLASLDLGVKAAHAATLPAYEYACLMEYAGFCEQLKKYPEAIAAAEQTRHLCALHFGRNDPRTQQADLRVGEAYFEAGDFQRAEPILKKTFEQFRHPASGLVAVQTEDPALAGPSLYKYRFNTKPDLALDAIARLDFIYRKQNRTEDIAFAQKQIFELLEQETFRSATSLPANLMVMCRARIDSGQFDEAKDLYFRLLSFEGKAKTKARDASFKAAMMLEEPLAGTFANAKRTVDAASVYEKTIEAADAGFGAESQESNTAQANYTDYLVKSGQPERAIALLERQLQHAEKLKIRGVLLQPVLENLSTAYKKTGDEANLARVCGKKIINLADLFGESSPALVPLLQEQAALLRKQGNATEAAQLEARALAIKSGQSVK